MIDALKDPKTTVTGLVLAVVAFLATIGVEVPEWVTQVAIGVGAVALMFLARGKAPQAG